MKWLLKLTDFILHLDKYINILIQDFGVWTYLVLFLIIFCETGLVVMPFLPGDSLLFAVVPLQPGVRLIYFGCLSFFRRPQLLATLLITGSGILLVRKYSKRKMSGSLKKNTWTVPTNFMKSTAGKPLSLPVSFLLLNLCPFRCRYRQNDLLEIYQLQHYRWHRLGGNLLIRRVLFRKYSLCQKTFHDYYFCHHHYLCITRGDRIHAHETAKQGIRRTTRRTRENYLEFTCYLVEGTFFTGMRST